MVAVFPTLATGNGAAPAAPMRRQYSAILPWEYSCNLSRIAGVWLRPRKRSRVSRMVTYPPGSPSPSR